MTYVIDFHNMVDQNSTKEERKKLNIGDIYSNGIKCKLCGYYIRSRNRHDFVRCECGACAIDGGSWYAAITGNIENIEVRTIFFKDILFN